MRKSDGKTKFLFIAEKRYKDLWKRFGKNYIRRQRLCKMITNGENEIRRVLAIMPDGKTGAPCGACREFMAQLMMGRYQDVEIMLDFENEKIVTLDDAEYTGGLIELYDSTMAFIKNNTKNGWRKDNDKRVELPDYPERALEEGLVNALIHRSYLQTGANSQVDIYDDRIVITNPGGMFDGSEVQLLDIRHVPSKLRNPILADVFGRMRLMERRGSGFKKILDAYEEEERYKEELKPIFYTDVYNFFLTLWNLNYAYDKAQNKAQKSQMTDREHILLLLKENPSLTQVELSEMMDKSRRTVQMLMKELLDEGTIERIGSKKKGSWLVK